MTVTYTVGDTREVIKGIPDGSVDLIASSPPFLALRSYVPADHESKGDEIGSERNPAEFIDMLLGLTAEWGRVLAAHGSIAIELGDTYSGSGGAGGDYNDGGLRDGQGKVDGSAARANPGRAEGVRYQGAGHTRSISARPVQDSLPKSGAGWPRAKSLALIPQLYAVALAYGINPLTGAPSPAGRWLVRNCIVWHRPNPAVGALGDKVRPSTSYIVVATRSAKRWFDLTAVRHAPANGLNPSDPVSNGLFRGHPDELSSTARPNVVANAAGAPPLDTWFDPYDSKLCPMCGGTTKVAATWHVTRPGETPLTVPCPDCVDGKVSTDPYDGSHDTWTLTTQPSRLAHYAMWPAKLAERLILSMCPREVCRVCGEPRRRVEGTAEYVNNAGRPANMDMNAFARRADGVRQFNTIGDNSTHRTAPTLGWTDCGHGDFRPGLTLDPFAGSGTTLAVADLHGRDAIGIDFDARNKAIYPARYDEVKRALYGTPAPMPGQETFDFAI